MGFLPSCWIKYPDRLKSTEGMLEEGNHSFTETFQLNPVEVLAPFVVLELLALRRTILPEVRLTQLLSSLSLPSSTSCPRRSLHLSTHVR